MAPTTISTSAVALGARTPHGGPSVVCAIEAELSCLDAARTAAALAGPGHLALVGIAEPDRDFRGNRFLAAARSVSAREGSTPEVGHLVGGDPVGALVSLAGARDLLVVGGSNDDGRYSAVARAVVRRASGPVLVARRRHRGDALSDRIVVATADAIAGTRALRMAHALAERDGGEVVAVLAPDDADAIVDAARGLDATLVVIGATARRVAARVAASAPCSVLVSRSASR